MLIERAVFQPLLKHRHLAAERLVVKSCVHIVCSNGKDRFKHYVLYVADFGQKSSQDPGHFIRHIPKPLTPSGDDPGSPRAGVRFCERRITLARQPHRGVAPQRPAKGHWRV